MRWCGWLLVAACNTEPSLDVAVHHPAGYAVAQTLVTVYFGGDISCEQIQFGDRSDAELAAIAVQEVDATSGGRIEVSRLGDKSIVARGYDTKHRFLTAGCVDLGVIAGATRVEIDTQPTATVAIDPGQPDRPFSERQIFVRMTDPSGKLLDGLVSWQLTGPAGSAPQTASDGMRTRNGNIQIEVGDLGVPGPSGLRIRAPWATTTLPLVTAFDLSHLTMISLGTGTLGDRAACDVRRRGPKLPSLVCLTPSNAGRHRNAVEIEWQVDRYISTPIAIPAGMVNQVALFVDHDGSADEPVYVLSDNPTGTNNWYRLGAPSGTNVTFAASLQNVVYVPRCADNSVTALVGVQTGTTIDVVNQIQFYTPSGAPVGTGPMSGEIFSGGCIDDVTSKQHQAVVVTGAAGEAALEMIVPGNPNPVTIATPRFAGSGFVTVEVQGMTERRFAGTRLQATGTVVFQAVLAPGDKSNFMLLERSEVDAAAPPEKIIAGKLDRDGDSDLMWDMGIGARRRVFQVSLAEQVSGAPLTAMTSGPAGVTATNANPTDFAAADLNGLQDASGVRTDEMILFTPGSVSIYSPDG